MNPFHARAWRRLAQHGHLGGQHSSSNGTSTRDIPPLPARHETLLMAMDEGVVSDPAPASTVLAEFERERRRLAGLREITPF